MGRIKLGKEIRAHVHSVRFRQPCLCLYELASKSASLPFPTKTNTIPIHQCAHESNKFRYTMTIYNETQMTSLRPEHAASEIAYIVSGGAINSTHSLTHAAMLEVYSCIQD